MFLAGLSLSLQAQTSEDSLRLEEGVKRFPEADANKDGVLTAAEARAFMRKKRGQNTRPEVTAAQAPEGGERHVYKNATCPLRGSPPLRVYLLSIEIVKS
jgi:hypothetical protein